MVNSKLNGSINYKEIKTIDPEDLKYNTNAYESEILGIPLEFALGKEKYTYMSKNVIYYPIYVLKGDVIKSQIGVYEIMAERKLGILDEDGDIDVSKLDAPLLYSFVTEEFIKKAIDFGEPIKIKESKDESGSKDGSKDESGSKEESGSKDGSKDGSKEESDIDDETDVMKPKSAKPGESPKPKKEGIFTINASIKPLILSEETEEMSDEIKKEYRKSSRNKWVEDFFKNNQYNIVETSTNGDCFFDTIRLAFQQIGHETSIHKLREIVANEIDGASFQEKRNFYLGFESEIKDIEKKMESLKETNGVYAKRIKKTNSTKERDELISGGKKIATEYAALKEELDSTKSLQELHIGYMKNIDTIEKYREYIMTSSYWADAGAISTLERVLNIKMVILSEHAYKAKDLDGVMNCGEINKKLEEVEDFKPNFYIMTNYTGDHYELITYKNKRIFTFPEMPYDVKILVINKCLEKNSGIFYKIPEFRNLKLNLGIDADEGKLDEDEEDGDHGLYTKDVIFMFYGKSSPAKPGKGTNETIAPEKVNDFKALAKMEDWRRKLDDTWSDAIFTVDHHRWTSVEHYVQAAKYKKGFPDFYLQFSLDSDSEISKDVAIAKAAGESGKHEGKIWRPKEVKADIDYNLGRDVLERELALQAKFEQNEDMKQLLKATHHALLNKFVRRGEPVKDTILMKIRGKI